MKFNHYIITTLFSLALENFRLTLILEVRGKYTTKDVTTVMDRHITETITHQKHFKNYVNNTIKL